jgi:hypothetical protein
MIRGSSPRRAFWTDQGSVWEPYVQIRRIGVRSDALAAICPTGRRNPGVVRLSGCVGALVNYCRAVLLMKMHMTKVPIAGDLGSRSMTRYLGARPHAAPQKLDAHCEGGLPGAVLSDSLKTTGVFTPYRRLRTVGVRTNDGGRDRHQQTKHRRHTGKHQQPAHRASLPGTDRASDPSRQEPSRTQMDAGNLAACRPLGRRRGG